MPYKHRPNTLQQIARLGYVVSTNTVNIKGRLVVTGYTATKAGVEVTSKNKTKLLKLIKP